MLRINIVYQNNNMPADILPAIKAPDGSYEVTWSRQPQTGSDAVIYFNHYTYKRRIHDRICPHARKILYMYEPPAIDPMQYTKRVWKQFDAILTWNTYLTESSSAFTFEAGAYYDLPYCFDYGIRPLEGAVGPSVRKRAIVQICGDKYSLSAEEIYSERRKVARWFHKHAKTPMDVFGRPPMDTPNYRGECADKAETMARYRYALCFENTFHPLWTRGYVTEKILDCMAAGTIPIYYGCSNIEDLVPPDCFIDYRKFSSLEELDETLQTMTDEEYLDYADRMYVFLERYNAPDRHSVHRLYEAVVKAVRQYDVTRIPVYPEDYVTMGSLNARCRLAVMRLLLPYYRFIYPLFALIRLVKKGLLR
jgi:hypothetical protein